MSIVMLTRLPIISVLLLEVYDFIVIIGTIKRMISPFLSIVFSFLLFFQFYAIIGQILYSGNVRLTHINTIENAGGNALYY